MLAGEFAVRERGRGHCDREAAADATAEGSSRGAGAEEVNMTQASTESLTFERVAEELSNPLRRYLERLAGDRATAEDFLQETLVKIARGRVQFLSRRRGRLSLRSQTILLNTRATGSSRGVDNQFLRIYRNNTMKGNTER